MSHYDTDIYCKECGAYAYTVGINYSGDDIPEECRRLCSDCCKAKRIQEYQLWETLDPHVW